MNVARVIKRCAALALSMAFALLLAACAGDKPHEEILSEISQENAAYQQKRQAFLSSDTAAAAKAFVEDTLTSLLPERECAVSLEPGELIDVDLAVFADLTVHKSARLAFFSKADLTIQADLEGDKAQEICSALLASGVSGRLIADVHGENTYRFDAVTGDMKVDPKPGV